MEKKELVFILILIIAINQIYALSTFERNEINSCKRECTLNNKLAIKECNNFYKDCNIHCREKTNTMSKRACSSACSLEKKECLESIKFKYSDCNPSCSKKNENITCENNKYIAGEVFLEDCQMCKCNIKGNKVCRKTLFCNHKSIEIEKDYCIENNGLFQQLCNGPYFDIVCSQANFCICSGTKNYSCPNDYTCIHDFTVSLARKSDTIPGWKNYIGHPLGDIGICAKKITPENCGNDICENKVCNSETCNDAETKINCPNDCK